MLAGNEPTRNNMVTGERLTNRFALVSVIMILKNKHAFVANTCQSNGQSRRLKFSTCQVEIFNLLGGCRGETIFFLPGGSNIKIVILRLLHD